MNLPVITSKSLPGGFAADRLRRSKTASRPTESGHYIRANQGFTLVELLVVIAIIAILVVLIIPFAKKSIAQAKSAGCIHNLRQIGIGMRMYANDNEGRLPPYSTDGRSGASLWSAQISPYLDVPLETAKQAGASYLRCPAANPSVDVQTYTYGVNFTGANSPPVVTYPPEVDSSYPGSARFMNFRVRTILIVDAINFDYVLSPRFWPSSAGIATGPAPYNYADFNRHPGKQINALFSDGSSASVSLSDWATNRNHIAGE